MTDNMLHLNVNLNNLTNEERKQLLNLAGKSHIEKKSKVWKPEKGTKFYSVTPIGQTFENFYNCSDDYKYFQLGNAFKTKEEAKFSVEKQKLITEINKYIEENDPEELDWKNCHQAKYHLYYDFDYNCLYSASNHGHKIMNTIYFSSKLNWKKMISDIGEERIKKYLFNIRE